MLIWWNSLDIISQIFALIAIPATLILIVLMILLLFGIGAHVGDGADMSSDVSGLDGHDGDFGGHLDFGAHGDLDAHGDIGHSGDASHDGAHSGEHGSDYGGVHLFTLRGIVSMLAILGWSGLAMNQSGWSPALSVTLSILLGFATLVAIGYIMYGVYRLQSDGTIDYGRAVGKTGTVYIAVPGEMSGRGKINLTLQEQYIEADAMTSADRKLKTGEAVRVVGTDGAGVLLVEPVKKNAESVQTNE